MKRIFILFTVILFSMTLLACQNNITTDEKTYDINDLRTEPMVYEVNKSTINFPYQRYEFNFGELPLFQDDVMFVKGNNSLYALLSDNGELLTSYVIVEENRFNKDGYTTVELSNDEYNILNKSGEFFLEDNVNSKIYDFKTSENYLHFDLIVDHQSISYLYDIVTGDFIGNDISYNDLEENYSELFIDDRTYKEIVSYRPNGYSEDSDEPVFYKLVDQDGVRIGTHLYDYMDYGPREFITVMRNDLYGVYSYEGIEVIPPVSKIKIEFGNQSILSDLAPFVNEDDLLGFYDYEGNIVIEPTFDISEYYHELYREDLTFRYGVQLVTDGNVERIIDCEGNILFSTNETQDVIEYDDKLIAVQNSYTLPNSEDTVYIVDIIDYDGKIIHTEVGNYGIAFTYDDTDIFIVKEDEYREIDTRSYYAKLNSKMYDYSGKLLMDNIMMSRDSGIGFVHDLMPIMDKTTGLYGYINTANEWVISPHFDGAGNFRSDDLAVVEINERYVLIDKTGEVFFQYIYSYPISFTEESKIYLEPYRNKWWW